MPTRKEFCQSCLAMAVAGVGAPLLFGRGGDEEKKPAATQPEKIVAACGLTCSECPAFIATRKNDDALRAETAEKWSKMFHADIKSADINCDGCPGDSPRLFSYCAVCEIRKCARAKKFATCAACPEYPCEKLEKFLAQAPEARAALEALRQKG